MRGSNSSISQLRETPRSLLSPPLPCEFQSWTLTDEILGQAGLSRTVVESSIMQTRVEYTEAVETYSRK